MSRPHQELETTKDPAVSDIEVQVEPLRDRDPNHPNRHFPKSRFGGWAGG